MITCEPIWRSENCIAKLSYSKFCERKEEQRKLCSIMSAEDKSDISRRRCTRKKLVASRSVVRCVGNLKSCRRRTAKMQRDFSWKRRNSGAGDRFFNKIKNRNERNSFRHGGEGGIRTLVCFRTNWFRVSPVMTTSIPLQKITLAL